LSVESVLVQRGDRDSTGGSCEVEKTVQDVNVEQVHWARFRGPCDAIFAAIYDEL
jgi:hypothetical protein